jgi:phenylpropionate dioxygenase-like ring-hydroxylating dioxygenase large terminal subunit
MSTNSAIEPLLRELGEIARSSNAEFLTLPPEAYYSPELFEIEQEVIFRRGWVLIGREDQVARPGDYLALRVCGENIVMTRDRHGELHVLSNVCTHRWMPLCSGAGNTRFFSCPYHSWAFELDGRVRGAPGMEDAPGYDPDRLSLSGIRFERWKGFVFVNLDGAADPLGPQLAPLEAEIAEYRLEDWRVVNSIDWGESPWNWKTFQDNGDCYHHIGAHPETLEASFPGAASYSIPNNGAFTFIWSPMREKLLISDEDGRRMPGTEPLQPGLTERQRTAFCLIYVLPNYFIFVQPEFAAVARVFPTGPEEIYLYTDILLPPHLLDRPDTPELAELITAGLRRVHEEDIQVCTRVQQGLHSHFARRGPYSLLETHNRDAALYVARKVTAALDTGRTGADIPSHGGN